MKAIETEYKGYCFRSRLEARWAVFFDSLGVSWEYESEGFDLGDAGWYLPDFVIDQGYGSKIYVEVKGGIDTGKEFSTEDTLKVATLAAKMGRRDEVWILGGIPAKWHEYCFPVMKRMDNAVGGCVVLRNSIFHEVSGYFFSVELDIGSIWRWADVSSESQMSGFAAVADYNVILGICEKAKISCQNIPAKRGLDTICDAADAARSARFEHGQKGAQ